MFEVFELQRELVGSACPSGSEHVKIAPLLAKLAKPFADKISTDPLGNVICFKKGTVGGKKIMLAAHMDAIGFMVTLVDDKGFIWFDGIGGLRPAQLINTRVKFLNGTHGIIKVRESAKAMEKNLVAIEIGDLFIDIGAADKKDAEKHVKIGDLAIFEGETVKIAGNRLMGPYADDLIACTALLMTMERVKDCANDLYFVFTSQEEIGCIGAITAAYGIEPDIGLACDVCSTGDTPQNDDEHMAVCVGEGPTIKIKDRSVICSPQLNEKLRKIAKTANIRYQDEIMAVGGTDTCSIQTSRAGVHATCISIPTRYVHSAVEMVSISDVEGAVELLTAAVSAKL